MAVWVIVNVEEWDIKQTMPRTVLTPPAGGSPTARHSELGLARIRQPRRLLAHAESVRRIQDPRRARHQRLGARGLSADRRSRQGAQLGIHGPRLHPAQHAEGGERARGHPQDRRRDRQGDRQAAARLARPGLTETWETPDLLQEEGYDYVADWVLDDQPVWLKTTTTPIVNVPYTQECNDVAMMLIQHHKASEYYDRAIDQFEQIYDDAADSARIMALGLASLHHGCAAPAEILPPHLRNHPEEVRRRVHDRRTDSRLVSLRRTETAIVEDQG